MHKEKGTKMIIIQGENRCLIKKRNRNKYHCILIEIQNKFFDLIG